MPKPRSTIIIRNKKRLKLFSLKTLSRPDFLPKKLKQIKFQNKKGSRGKKVKNSFGIRFSMKLGRKVPQPFPSNLRGISPFSDSNLKWTRANTVEHRKFDSLGNLRRELHLSGASTENNFRRNC